MKNNPKTNRVTVFDTTLRDGEQAPGCHMTAEQKLEVAWQLKKCGVDVIEAGFPVSSPAEFGAVQAIANSVGQGDDAPEIAGLARCVNKDIDVLWDAIKSASRPRIHIFISTSDIHMEHKLKMSRDQVVNRAVEAVRHAKSYTSNVQFSAEDASRSDRAFLARTVQAVIEAGATTVNIPDTVGYATPTDYFELIRFLIENVPNADQAFFSVHCHDDLGMSVANSVMALKAGARQVECTINGIGERAGNCALEEVVMTLTTRSDVFSLTTGVNSKELYPTCKMVSAITGIPIPPNKAVVGANAFAHGSGVHQDGVIKNKITYEIIKPEEVGAPDSQLILTARSGRNALVNQLEKMGAQFSEADIPELYQRFKAIADQKRIVSKSDLRQLL